MRVIVTIDTEGHDGMDPVEHLIWGKCSDGTYHGIDEIMDILDNNNATGLFFWILRKHGIMGKTR